MRVVPARFFLLLPIISLAAVVPAPRAAQAQTPQHRPIVRHGKPRHHQRHVEQTPGLPLPLPPPLPFQEQAPVVAGAAATKPAPAKKPEEKKPAEPSLPVPRFASLRTDEVNLRAGPGFRYPIVWLYKRRFLPVEIERDFEVWRLIMTPGGTRGWVHEATLTGRRTFVIRKKETTLLAAPRDDAAPVARLMPGVIGFIRYCHKDSDWCRLAVDGHDGFLRRSQFWGTLPGEVIPAP